MSAPSLSELFQIGVHILKTSVSEATQKILAQIGSVVGEGQVDADNVEWWQHVGFASRPSKAVPGKEAAQAVVIRQGTIDAAIASQDLRGLDLYGALAEGETCVYAAGEDGVAQARLLLKANGSLNLFTKAGNATGGRGMGMFINPNGSISIASSNGAGILIGTDGSLKCFNAAGGVQILANGKVKISSNGKIAISGTSVTLGGGATSQPLAKATSTSAAISALQTQLTAVSAALAAVATAASNPATQGGAPAAAAPAVAATTAGSLAVAAASQLIPCLRVVGD